MGEVGGILLFALFAVIAVVKKKAQEEESQKTSQPRPQRPAPLPRRLEPSAQQPETAYEQAKREYQEHVEEYNRNLESSNEALRGLRDGFVMFGEAVQEATEENDAPAASYQYYEPLRRSEKSLDAPAAAKKRPLTSTTLRDDRKNDWMAKQLREEARIKSSTDLGALHDVNCEAREIKERHAALHSAGRVDY